MQDMVEGAHLAEYTDGVHMRLHYDCQQWEDVLVGEDPESRGMWRERDGIERREGGKGRGGGRGKKGGREREERGRREGERRGEGGRKERGRRGKEIRKRGRRGQ